MSADASIQLSGSNVVEDSFDPNNSYPYRTNRFIGSLAVTNIDIGNNNYYGEVIIGNPIECDSASAPVMIDPNGNSRTVRTGSIGLQGHYNFHYDEELTSFGPTTGNGCVSTVTVMVVREIMVPPTEGNPADIGQLFVSLTEAFWARGKGKLNGVRGSDLMQWLLTNPQTGASDPLVVGKPGRSLSIPLDAVEWLHVRLPAKGAVGPLPSFGDQILSGETGQTSPALPLNKKHNFENRLIGEVVSLALNLRLDESFSEFNLSMLYCTKNVMPGRDRLIGTADDVTDWLGPDRLVETGDEVQHHTLPAPIFEALCYAGLPPTPAGLLELGNLALAGHTPHPATYAELDAAIETVNASFEGGRICVACE